MINKIKAVFILIISVLLILLNACEKTEESTVPEIWFKTGEVYAQNDDTVEVGYPLNFGVQARSTESMITNFVIKKVFADGSYKVAMDTGLYAMTLNIDKTFYQGVEDVVEWTFSVMCKNRLSAHAHMKINKDPNSQFGGVVFYPSITMGYQQNIEFGQFLDLNEGKVYFEDSAEINQSAIELLSYYIEEDDLPSPVFSSAGEYDNYSTEASGFYPSIQNWSTRNYTLWDISVDNDPVSVNDFDNCHNDSLLIVSYHDVWGKKKFKWATEGRVIPFQRANGKKGLLKVIRADETETGSIEFAIKMQL
ncbi:MAG: hypothetical protein C0594_05945 [Marinilabiliales bacterium]|nr:MAG: hypothetical protein C0594_05945 [Marinilabiliales bacterium]